MHACICVHPLMLRVCVCATYMRIHVRMPSSLYSSVRSPRGSDGTNSKTVPPLPLSPGFPVKKTLRQGRGSTKLRVLGGDLRSWGWRAVNHQPTPSTSLTPSPASRHCLFFFKGNPGDKGRGAQSLKSCRHCPLDSAVMNTKSHLCACGSTAGLHTCLVLRKTQVECICFTIGSFGQWRMTGH